MARRIPFLLSGRSQQIEVMNGLTSEALPAYLVYSGTNGTAFNSTGQLVARSANVVRHTYDPSTQRINAVANSTMQGAVRGVVGAGGSLPTGWSTNLSNGITHEVLDIGTLNGLPYITIRMSGTAIASPHTIGFHALGTADAQVSQQWCGSFFVNIAGGSTTNITQVRCEVYAMAGGSTVQTSLVNIAGISSSIIRATAPITTTDAGITGIRSGIALGGISTSLPSDITLRIFAPQLERGLTATDFIPTSGQAASVCQRWGFMSEPPRTNVMAAASITSAGSNLSVSYNAAVAPDGTTTAAIVRVTNAGLNPNWMGGGGTNPTFTSGQAWSSSVFIRRIGSPTGANRFFSLRWRENSGFTARMGVDVDLSTMAVQAYTSAGTTIGAVRAYPVGNDWWRLEMDNCVMSTFTQATLECVFTNALGGSSIQALTGNGVDGIAIWGLQFEIGATCTSYIYPTLSRTADMYACTALATAGINPIEGGLMVQYVQRGIDTPNAGNYINLGGAGSSTLVFRGAAASGIAAQTQSGVNGGLGNVAYGSTYKVALRYRSGDNAAAVNGSPHTGTTYNSSVVDAPYTRLDIGNRAAADRSPSAVFQRMLAFPTPPSNQYLQEITA